jgi:scyllo-inositol 2-dehydrogenase (NADP+)
MLGCLPHRIKSVAATPQSLYNSASFLFEGRMGRVINVGIVGYGMATKVFHAPLISADPQMRLTHILKRSGDEPRTAYPDVHIARTLDDLLKAPVELIVVATPTTTHFEIATAALAAGKHVVVDKPFTTTSAEAGELIALSQKHQRVLSVFQNRRWDGDFLTVRRILDQKLLGRLVDYESHFDRYRPSVNPSAWREQSGPGSGWLYDLGSHLIDQALVLFGWPQRIYADVRLQRDNAQANDNFELILDYPGLKVTLKTSMLVRESSPRFILHGTQGSYVKYGLDPQEEALKQGKMPVGPEWGAEHEESWGTLNTGVEAIATQEKFPTIAGCYPAYYENVCRAIREETSLIVKPEQGRDTIRLIELAMQSNAEKCAVPVGMTHA